MGNIENPESGDNIPNMDDIRRERVKESVPSLYVFEGYCDNLDIKPEDLKSKKILDVGSGADEDFSRRAAQFGAEVIS
jgi:hypothetical protein